MTKNEHLFFVSSKFTYLLEAFHYQAMKNQCLYLIFILTINACSVQINKAEKLKSNIQIVNVPVIEKPFIKKNGEPTDRKEFYLQTSIKDYYIKFCESKVKEADLKERLDRQTGSIKTLKLEVAFKTGEWDRCDEEAVQSRVGDYVVIYQLLGD